MAEAIIRVDDLDNSLTATHQVRFMFGGRYYEIDLCRDNHTEFEEFMARYVNAARDITQTSKPQSLPRVNKYKDKNSIEDVRNARNWARANGIDVYFAGPVRQEVIDLWRAAGSPQIKSA